jgi:hypothetical protein
LSLALILGLLLMGGIALLEGHNHDEHHHGHEPKAAAHHDEDHDHDAHHSPGEKSSPSP